MLKRPLHGPGRSRRATSVLLYQASAVACMIQRISLNWLNPHFPFATANVQISRSFEWLVTK